MKQINTKVLTAIIAASAILLTIGNLMIVKSLQPQNFSSAVIHTVLGAAIVLLACLCGKKRVLKAAPYFLAAELILLLLCPISGVSLYGACRWLRIGCFSIMPAMPAMFVLCLFWAYIKNKSGNEISRKNQLVLLSTTLITAILVFIEPFYSMTVFILLLTIILLFLAGINWKKAAVSAAVIIVAIAAFTPYLLKKSPLAAQKNFYCNLFDPSYDTQYHSWSLLTTLKHSVFCGHHNVPETPKYHIPNAITDSALIAGCGEYGYVFLIAALLLTTAIIICGILISMHCKNPADRLLSGGMTAVIALPALTNIFMMFGLLPVGGVTFPFLAYGRTAMIANALAIVCIILPLNTKD